MCIRVFFFLNTNNQKYTRIFINIIFFVFVYIHVFSFSTRIIINGHEFFINIIFSYSCVFMCIRVFSFSTCARLCRFYKA